MEGSVYKKVVFAIISIILLFQGRVGNAEVSGYLKTLWLSTNTVIGEEKPVDLGIYRSRVTWRQPLSKMQLLLSYDIEWRIGSFLDTDQYHLQQQLLPDTYWDLENELRNEEDEEINHGLYRAYIRMPIGPIDIRIGRQQINWARSFIWSSFDRFNPYNPLQLEPEERQGIDAAQLIWNREDGSRVEFVSVGGQLDEDKALGMRFRTHIKATDFDFVLADYGAIRAAGVSAAGQWAKAGWRFETTINEYEEAAADNTSSRYYDAVLSVDYTFESETTLIAELLYRGDGENEPQEYDWLSLLAGKRTDLAKRYIGLIVKQGFDPIAGVDITWLYNTTDKSYVFLPSVRYSPGSFENFYFRTGFQWFNGRENTEFGRQEQLVFGEIQWFY